MKLRTSFLTRCLALAVALVLLVSGSNLGMALQVFAADSSEATVTVGQLVANNYALSDAEKALLSSGLLAGDSITYAAPADSLVTVDTDNEKIIAESKDGWVPTTAVITYGGKELTVDVVDGVAAYDANVVGNAFSVKVNYVLTANVPVATQEALLNAGYLLKADIANADSISAQSGNLYILEQAMPELVKLAANDIAIGNTGSTAGLSDAAKADINALNGQMKTNNGVLDLSKVVAEYEQSVNAQYVVTKADAMQAAVNGLLSRLGTISGALNTLNNNLSVFIQYGMVDAETGKLITTLAGVVNNLKTGLEAASAHTWASKSSHYVSGVDYATLNGLVAALGTASAVTFGETLKVAETAITVNMSMWDVTVKVVLNTVNADNEIAKYGEESTVLTMGDGISKADVQAEIEASGFEAATLASWSAYVEGKFDRAATELADTLTSNVEYVITYSPKNYKVDLVGEVSEHPYGYKLTLPLHPNAESAYDYTVNGEQKSQGETVVIEGDTTITRTSGKAYATTDLYTVIADNYGNDVAKAILKSGALKNNEIISYRKPDPADAGSLLKLLDGTLTAQDYTAAYQGLSWAPYTYGASGTENAFSGNTAAWSDDSAKVQYKLTLSNYSAAEVQAILELAAALKAEADEQTRVLDALAKNYETMGQLDKTKLGALNGVIDVTDFSTDPQKNQELRNYFKSVVSGIINNNLDGNMLKIYNMIGEYKTNGLRYYYNNSAEVINEINSLSGYLDDLLEEEAALKIMVSAAGFPEYADKISGLQGEMASVKAALTAPNAAIDLNSDKLGALVAALIAEGDVQTQTAASPYIMSEILTVLDQSSVMIQIIIETPNGSATVTSEAMKKGTEWDVMANGYLFNQKNEKIYELLGGRSNLDFYNELTEGTWPTVGTKIETNINVYYTYTEKDFTVKIDGEEDQTISISDLEVDLPKHTEKGWSYTYTVDGQQTTAATYTFTKEQVTNLFENGVYTITRTEKNEAEENFVNKFADWVVKNEKGEITGLYAPVNGNQDGLTGFAMTLVNSGYSYIGLNGEPLMYMNEENTTEVLLQTLINAILADNSFSSQTLIDLGNNGGGKLVNAKIDLGNSADDIIYSDLDFTLELTSVPAQMATVANGLTTIAPYLTFQSKDGVLLLNVDLPEKVYEAYLAAMLATGNVDKYDIAALNSDIALQFLWDYIDLILNTEANTTTYTNTLRKLGVESYDLTGYEKYYNMVKKALTNDGFVINSAKDEIFDINVTGKSQAAIKSLINALGIDVGSYETYLGMIKEYKDAEATLSAGAIVNLVDAGTAFEAAIIDVNALKASGIKNKLQGADFTTNLPSRLSTVTGAAAVMLLDDVDGDLVFPGTTVLDLNGQTVNGNITANGTLYIIDSSVDTYNCGWVSGSVSGNVTILGGNYSTDVSAFLKDGYYVDGTTVRNALFYIEEVGGTTTIVLNADVYNDEHVTGYIPNAQALAIDIACDLALNYYMSAGLSVDGSSLINVSLEDIVGLISGGETTNKLLKEAAGWFTFGQAGYENNVGLEAFVNQILEDLLDVASLGKALENGTAVATYGITTQPWSVTLSHIADGDYITMGIASNANLAKSFNLALKLESKYTGKVGNILTEMGKIIVSDETYAVVDIPAPGYANKQFNIAASGKAGMVVDMSVNKDYAIVVGVILANGGAANKTDIADAINAGDMDALEAAIINVTVQELISSLKFMARNVDFAAMCTKAGITADLTSAAELEGIYHLMLCGIGKGFDVAKINGMNVKLGNYLKDGYYILDKENISRDVTVSYSGYSALITLTADVVEFKLKLFGDEPDCLLGDANHDGVVNSKDAALILKYTAGNLPEDTFICLVRTDVNGDGSVNSKDAALILKLVAGNITKFPVEE